LLFPAHSERQIAAAGIAIIHFPKAAGLASGRPEA
jgi:hypothetical protein